MPTSAVGHHLLSVEQVASELSRSRSTILRLIANGDLAARKLGSGRTSAYVITADEIDRYKREERAA